MSKWTDALEVFLDARDSHVHSCRNPRSTGRQLRDAERALAQAADVLDREHEAVVRRLAAEER